MIAAVPLGVVASGALPLAVLVAVAAGLVSFASPCVLPLVPGFLGYLTGGSRGGPGSRPVAGAAIFVLGFSLVFVLEVSTASAVGALLREHQSLLTRLGGVVVLLSALVFAGMGPQRSLKLRWRPPAGLAGAPLLGWFSRSGGPRVWGPPWRPC
jgi:cytochrome c-type biogenesis protein